jgi:heterodisulfide reductase subunit C
MPVLLGQASTGLEKKMRAETIQVIDIGGDFACEVVTRSGASPMSCYQCLKCSSGCPIAARGDLKPHELVRMIQLNQSEAVLASRFIWECTSCQTCITRCPQKVNIAAMNDVLRVMSCSAGKIASGTVVPVFNALFLKAIQKRGRVHEANLMAGFKLRTRRLFEDLSKLPTMVLKGKLSISGTRVAGLGERKAMFLRAGRGGEN